MSVELLSNSKSIMLTLLFQGIFVPGSYSSDETQAYNKLMAENEGSISVKRVGTFESYNESPFRGGGPYDAPIARDNPHPRLYAPPGRTDSRSWKYRSSGRSIG